jgi:ABC-type branched-subunit amino acid transport system substrate-binding protein
MLFAWRIEPDKKETWEWNMPRLQIAAAAVLMSLILFATTTIAQKKYDPGASDTEIKLGQTMPYSGPLSGFITLAKAEIAYLQMINDQGGVNGRKITMISLDDGSSPPKTVEQTRRLVEADQVLAISGSLGTATNAAIQKYLNTRKVPQLFLATGASRWNDPEHFPYTMTLTPIYQAEARIYATYVLREVANPKVAVLYQNDDFGKDFLKGFRDRLGDKAAAIMVREVSYEVTDATVDSQMIDLASTHANVFLNISTPTSPCRRSARPMTSAGGRCSSSTTPLPRSALSCGPRASRLPRASSRRPL